MVILESRRKERMHSQEQITQRLERWASGDEEALDEIINDLYQVLKQLTRRKLRGQSMLNTLDPASIVSEVYRYFQSDQNTRTRFHSLAAPMVRRILADLLHQHQIGMRGITVNMAGNVSDDLLDGVATPPVVLLALDRALYQLSHVDPRQCRLVELRCFGGLTLEELAQESGLSPDSVKREWREAEEWLIRQLQPGRRLSA